MGGNAAAGVATLAVAEWGDMRLPMPGLPAHGRAIAAATGPTEHFGAAMTVTGMVWLRAGQSWVVLRVSILADVIRRW